MENFLENSDSAPAPEPISSYAEPTPEPVAVSPAPAPKKKYADPRPVDLDAVVASLPQPAGDHVVGNGVVDTVLVSRIIYKNLYARKSLSVHHLQRRLVELGYADAGRDKDGWFGDRTLNAVKQFQRDRKLPDNGEITLKLLSKIFDGDPNVEVAE
jgi:peptidoglycan hydrolase-like protein with peptidoglycan-binding domain